MARFLKNKTIALLLMLTALLPAQADNARVSLLTCSPGEEVYELFGHTALRYTDPDKKLEGETLLAIRGVGKFRVLEGGTLTRRERLRIKVQKFK